MSESVVADVEEFILSELTLGSAIESIAPDDDLLSSGIVDSHGLLQLVAFLAARFGVTVPEEELTPENFQSLSSIDGLVGRLRG